MAPRLFVHFYSGNDLIGRGIRLITHSRFSHVAISVDDTLYEAIRTGIHTVKGVAAETRIKEATVSVPIWVGDDEVDRTKTWLQAQVGHGYSFSGIVAILVALLTGFRLVIAVDGEFFCSGYVSMALLIAGESEKPDPRLETPGSLALDLGVRPF